MQDCLAGRLGGNTKIFLVWRGASLPGIAAVHEDFTGPEMGQHFSDGLVHPLLRRTRA